MSLPLKFDFQVTSKAFCRYRWEQPVIHFGSGEVCICCRTPSQHITAEDLGHMGSDAFLNTECLRERRKEILEDVRHKDCNECWALEDVSIQRISTPLVRGHK